MRNTQESKQGSSVLATTLACSIALLLGACNKESAPQDQVATTATVPAARNQSQAPNAMEWARDALTRNPQVELVATDANAQVFTIRNKQTGEVSAVKLNELAAAPIAQLTATTPSEQTSPALESESAQVAAAPATQGAATNTAQSSAPPSSTPTPGDPSGNYTIERSDGQVRVTGPGVSIVSSGSGSEGDLQGAAQNAVEPIICEGRRMVHLDNREIFVEGDAITVRGGCELYITNSRVVATRTGIVVQDGIVHVSNSHIEGQEGSFDADSRAKVFVRASTFRGLPRRSELAQVQDQGGNRWR
jgi:hypothetical protein